MAKTKQFELMGALLNHPGFPNAQRGDTLKLEVGDDNLPTSELLRSRVRPLGASLETGDELTEKEAKGKASEIIKDAKAQAKQIVADAEDKAAGIIDKANTDAVALMDAAKP